MARPFPFLLSLLLCILTVTASANSLVVLPFTPETQDPKYTWIGESNAEAISDILARNSIFILDREDRLQAFRTLGVRASSTRTLATSLKVAMELDAGFAVLGTFHVVEAEPVAESRIVLTATVMDVGKWRKLSEIRVEGQFASLCLLETRVAFLILRALGRDLSQESEEDFLARFPPVRLDARENYVRGLLADSAEARHRFFAQSARLDASYSAPAVQLGLLFWQKRDYRQAAQWLRKALDTASRKQEVQFMLGFCEAQLGRYPEAESHFRALYNAQALPEFANNLAVVLGRQRKEGAVELFTFAADGDPEDPDYRFNLGHALWLQERYEEAADRFREVLDLAGDDPEATRMLGRSLQREASRPARAAVENLNRLKEDFAGPGLAGGVDASFTPASVPPRAPQTPSPAPQPLPSP